MEDFKEFVREYFDFLLLMIDSEEEQEALVDMLGDWLNEKIDIPVIPEAVEGKFIKGALKLLVDQLVKAFLEEKVARGMA